MKQINQISWTWVLIVAAVSLSASYFGLHYYLEAKEIEAPAYAFIAQEYPQGSAHFRQLVQDAMKDGKVTQGEYHAIFKDRMDANGSISIPMRQDIEGERKALAEMVRLDSVVLMLEHDIQPVEGAFGPVRLVNTGNMGTTYRGCRYIGSIQNIESKADADKAKVMTITRRICPDGHEVPVNLSTLFYPPFVARAGDVFIVTSN
jgi:hypothetical protein